MSIESSSIMVQDGLGNAGKQLNQYAEAIVDELNRLINQLAPIAETWTRSEERRVGKEC